MHGSAEVQAFERLGNRPAARTETLCRLTLLGMLPALAERDLDGFGEALYEFNRLVGEAFRAVQGGIYAHPGSEELVAFVRREGVQGVGQSSWGPTLYAVVGDEEQAQWLARGLRQRFGFSEEEILWTPVANHGADVSQNAD